MTMKMTMNSINKNINSGIKVKDHNHKAEVYYLVMKNRHINFN